MNNKEMFFSPNNNKKGNQKRSSSDDKKKKKRNRIEKTILESSDIFANKDASNKEIDKMLFKNSGKKKEPIDYRRGGTITLFVGIGLYLLGVTALGAIIEGIGLLVAAIGVGTIVAGYLFPNDSAEITNAVEQFEKK